MLCERTDIFLKSLKVRCHVGVPLRERNRSQIIDLDVWCELVDSEVTHDDIAATVSYSDVAKDIRRLLAARSFVLLETMTEEIAQLCFRYPLVQRVCVRACKPKKLPNCEAVGVERTFRR